MLQSPSVHVIAQAGVFYHPGGLGSPDTMFVEAYTPTLALPKRLTERPVLLAIFSLQVT